MLQTYDLRIEYPDGSYKDIQKGAESLHEAREKASADLQLNYPPSGVLLDWRGAVCFIRVNQAVVKTPWSWQTNA